MGPTEIIIATAGAIVALLAVAAFAASRMVQTPDPDGALVITTTSGLRVSFTAAMILPMLHRAERMSLAVQPIVIERRGGQGVVCRDKIRADLRITFLLRVNRTAEDVLTVAQVVGCARSSDPAAMHSLFAAKFTEAIESTIGYFNFADLHTHRAELRDKILEVIGRDLQGFILDDLAIDRLEQTPIEQLDPHNVSDAEAIRKLTEQAAEINIRTNELRRREATEIAHQNLIADEQILRIETQRAEAEAQHRQQVAHLSP
jgi:uncharacterized membrane protein YqiK